MKFKYGNCAGTCAIIGIDWNLYCVLWLDTGIKQTTKMCMSFQGGSALKENDWRGVVNMKKGQFYLKSPVNTGPKHPKLFGVAIMSW